MLLYTNCLLRHNQQT